MDRFITIPLLQPGEDQNSEEEKQRLKDEAKKLRLQVNHFYLS